MRFKLTVLLAILNLAVFSLIFYIDRVQSTRNVFAESSRVILDPAFVQGLKRVRISSSATGQSWQLVRSESGDWDVIDPVHWKANPFAVQQLLFQLKALTWESRFPVKSLPQAGQSLESYDLQDPPLQIQLENGSSTVDLNFGSPTEIGNRLYTLSPDGDHVLVISRGLRDTLQRDLSTFLDSRVFGLGMEESRVIQIQDRSASNIRVRMERKADGWRFVSPIEAAADNDRVRAMLADWQTLEGREFKRASADSGDWDREELLLTVEGLNTRETLSFAPRDEANAFYLARMEGYDTVFEVEREKVEELRNVQEALREKRILNKYAVEWTSLEIRHGELSTTLQQLESGAWQVLNTDLEGELQTRPADLELIGKVRILMRDMEAVRFVSDAPSETDIVRFGLDAPQRIVILRKADGTTIEFSIGNISRDERETLLYGTTSQQASVFLVRPHVLSRLPLDPMYYRERVIRALPDSAQIESVHLEDTETGQQHIFEQSSDEVAATTIRSYLKTVQVDRFLSKTFSNPLQLDRNTTLPWTFKLVADAVFDEATQEKPEQIVLYLTDRLGGTTQYIGDPASGLVGILPRDIIELLDPLMAEFPEDPGLPNPVEAPVDNP
jgi:hypothetical protein